MRKETKRKLGFFGIVASLVLSLSVSIGMTAAWFDDAATQESIDPGALTTNGLKTDALVYSGNAAHTNDDATAQTATHDEGGTYGYDHSQTGNGTSYYLMLDRDGNGSISLTSGDSLQMYTNIYNGADEACYFKLSLKAGDVFKIYDSDLDGSKAESWFGYDKIRETCESKWGERWNNGVTEAVWPFEEESAVYHNIKVKATAPTQVYDIYFDSVTGIWIDIHVDETRAKVTGALTGNYIVGENGEDSTSNAFSTKWSTSGGYAMYQDTEASNNKAVYLGLHLEQGDVFKITPRSDAPAGEWHGYSDLLSSSPAYSCFDQDDSGYGNIECVTTGYYNIFLNTSDKISIIKYTGTYSAGGINGQTAKGMARPPHKSAATKKTNTIYWRQSASTLGSWGKLYSYGGNTNNGSWPGQESDVNDPKGCYRGYLGDDNTFIINDGNSGNNHQTGNTSKSKSTHFYHHNATNNQSAASPVTPSLKFWHDDGNGGNWQSADFTYTSGTGFTYTTPSSLPSGTGFNFVAGGFRNERNGGEGMSLVVHDGWGSYCRVTGSDENYYLKARYVLSISISEEAYATYGDWTYGLSVTFTQEKYWTIHYDANGGTFTGTNDVYVGSGGTGTTGSYTPDYTNISRYGYTFTGWKLSSTTYSSGPISLTDGTAGGTSITLTAQWSAKTAKLRQSTTEDGTSYDDHDTDPVISGSSLTVTNAVLLTGRNYFIGMPGDDGLGGTEFWASLPSMTHSAGNVSVTSANTYFYSSNNNIGIKYGGTYSFTWNLSTKRCTSAHLVSLTGSDFKLKVDGGDTAFTSPSSDQQTTAFTWTKTGLHLGIGSELYVANNQGTPKNFKSGSGLTIDYGDYSRFFATTDGGTVKALVDCSVNLAFVFNATSGTGTLTITSFTKNEATAITHTQNSTVESGMYIVNNAGTTEYGFHEEDDGAVRMFFGTSENAGCRYAYSGLWVTDSSTIYRVREAAYGSLFQHLYEKVADQTILVFSNNGTGWGNDGLADGVYFKFVDEGTYDVLIYWDDANSRYTIEAKQSGKTVDVSSEHEGKWSLIGRGTAPASVLYQCDFTTYRSLPMWCAAGVVNPYPCYAGKINDGTGDTSSPAKGNTIVLLEGDQLALNTNNVLMEPTINSNYGDVDDNIVTITRSGNYYVYADDDDFIIERASALSGDQRAGQDFDLEADDVTEQHGYPISYTKMDGARVKRTSGNTLSFSAAFNASMLDAKDDGYFHVYVELRHINTTGAAGTLTAALSGISAPSNTKYSVKTYTNAASPVQSALGNLLILQDESRETSRISNANFTGTPTMYSAISVPYLNSAYFSVATIIDIAIPRASLIATADNGMTRRFSALKFSVSLAFVGE